MARKKNSGALEDLFEIAAMLPWWCGALLAVISYFFLHHYAVREIALATTPSQAGQMMVGQMTKTLASIFQYVLPLVFGAGAVASYLGREKRKGLAKAVADNPSRNALGEMSWQEFEMLVGEAFRQKGYQVHETGGGGADGGIDLVLKRGSELFLVQCKQWRAYKVSVNVVRELFGVMAAKNATGGFVVTSGEYTADAIRFAEGRNIELIDGVALKRMLQKAQGSVAVTNSIPVVKPTYQASPACPKCGGSMVKRIAKQGANAGTEFWGCQSFPACRGIRQLS
jgi:restriction system protein